MTKTVAMVACATLVLVAVAAFFPNLPASLTEAMGTDLCDTDHPPLECRNTGWEPIMYPILGAAACLVAVFLLISVAGHRSVSDDEPSHEPPAIDPDQGPGDEGDLTEERPEVKPRG